MKAVLLDWDTMGPGLDISKLHALLPDPQVFGDTDKGEVAEHVFGCILNLAHNLGNYVAGRWQPTNRL